MKTRMVFLHQIATLTLATVLLAACDQTTQAPPVAAPLPPVPRPIARPPAPASQPRPIVMTKPPILGPLAPSIVILPEHIDEPVIRVRLTGEEDRPPAVARNKYRGSIESLRLPNGKYVAINRLPLDSYLQGVLAKELYGSWEPATYRAQAIAARTFALFQMLTDGRSKQWDVNNDESSQMYGGIAGETAKSRAAVADTRGQVLTASLNGKEGIFCSRYSACIGGASQDPFDAWGDPSIAPLAAHLTGDVDANCDKFNWNRDFVVSKADLSRCINNWGQENQFAYLQNLGRIVSVKITKRNAVTNRPVEMLLTDSAGRSAPIRAEEFRLALLNDPLGRAPKPFSSNFEIRAQDDSFIMYNGRGYGHGIGMSQWGAQNLASQGRTHTQILAFFYPGARLKDLW